MDMFKVTGFEVDMGEGYWDMVIESYSQDAIRKITDDKYGAGASDFIVKAMQSYLHKQ